MGKPSRDKGSRGQTAARKMLESHGYHVDPITAGVHKEDIIAEYDGHSWSVEVKNTAAIDVRSVLKQAKAQASARGLDWWALCRVDGYPGCFLSIRKGEKPVVMTTKGDGE